jgi:hypothetical protein
MIAPGLTPDATRCPQCTAVLAGTGACGACGLRLTGPEAARLWEVDSELLRLDAARRPLLAERASLLAALRGEVAEPGSAPAAVTAAVAPAAPEWTPQRTSNALLGLGGLLLAVAALVFAAVTYERLGAGGRAVVLLTLTVLAGLAVPRVRLRGLTSTAETLTAVTLVLAALDAYGLRKLGLADGTAPLRYAAGSAAVLAVLSAGYAALVPVRLARLAAVLLAQLPLPLVLVEAEPPTATAALWLVGLAAADLAAVHLLRHRSRARQDVLTLTAACTAVVTAGALLCAAFAALGTQPGAGAIALLGCAGLLTGGAALARDVGLRVLLSALPVGVTALAAHALARPELSEAQSPLVPVAVALLAVQAAALLPRALRTGPVLGAWAVAAAAVAAIAESVVVAVVAPLSWLAEPWSLAAGGDARAALAPALSWAGTVLTPVVLVAAATAAVGGGLALHRLTAVSVPAGALAVAAAVLVPLGLDLPYGVTLAWLVALGAALALVPRPATLDLAAGAAATAVLLLGVVWSLADRTATLSVLPAVAAVMAGVALRAALPLARSTAAALAGLAATAELAAVGAATGLTVDQVGGLLLAAVAVLAALADPRLGAARRSGVEAAAVVSGASAVLLAAPDAGWLSWTLAGLALVALAAALRPDRRVAAVAGGLLLSASSWVRLADAGVTDPEPYVLPLALLALVLGHLRRQADPATRSFAAYGPGLSVLLVPSLLASYVGSPLWRPLSLAGVALVVVLLGARTGLQAPLAIGGGVLAADAVLLLAPYAAAMPRWLVLGAAGTLLVAVGATYEQRLRELGRLRERYDALA